MATAFSQPTGLVARCHAGESVAWSDFVDHFSSYVYAIAIRGYGLDRATAEDVFQEVFTRAYERIGDIRNDESARPWLGQVTRRLCVDRLRASARVGTDEGRPDVGMNDPALGRIEEDASVHAALRTLSEEHQDVLTRFFLQDQSYDTIAGDLAVPPGTVASRISRGLRALRQNAEAHSLGLMAIAALLGAVGLGSVDTELLEMRDAFSS